MNDVVLEPQSDGQARRHDPEAFDAERQAQITQFVRTNPDYYNAQFSKISRSSSFTPTLNVLPGVLGPIWFGARGLWKWAFTFLIVETFAFVQMALGWFGDLGADSARTHCLDRGHARAQKAAIGLGHREQDGQGRRLQADSEIA